MEEFNKLNWSWKRFQSDTELKKSYYLNLNENRKQNPGDVFHSHLLETDQIHLANVQQKIESSNGNASDTAQITPLTAILKDPRTDLQIPNYVCDYRDTDLASKNIFLQKFIEESKLSAAEQMACIEAIQRFSQHDTDMRDIDRENCEIYFATQATRAEEKKRFLEFLKNHSLKNLTHRCRTVSPAIEFYLQETWKMSVIELLQTITDDYYKIATAFQTDAFASVNSELVLQAEEHYGNLPEMCERNDLKFLRKQAKQLISDYENARNTSDNAAIQNKLNEWHAKHKPDFIMPISSVSNLLDAAFGRTQEWMIQATIQKSAFSCKNEIIFDKPLPPTYLSAMQKSSRGFKQLMRSTFADSKKNPMKSKTEEISIASASAENKTFTGEYKAIEFDEFLAKLTEKEEETSFTNITGNLWELSETSDSGSNTTRIFITCEQDAFRTTENNEKEFIYFSPKVEYQAEYGGEQMSLSELIDEWCFLYLQPKSSVYRVRCDVVSSEIIDRKLLSLSDVTMELQKLYQIQSKALISTLWNILKIINNFPNGDYLLCNEKKTGHRIKVYCKQNKIEKKNGTLHLPTIYSNVSYQSSVFDEVTWQPIDDTVLTEIHSRFKWFPCTFPHTKILNDLQTKSSVRRINPKDDRAWILRRKSNKQKQLFDKKQQSKIKTVSKNKRVKAARRRLKKNEEKNKTEEEKNELLNVMKLFAPDSTAKDENSTIGATPNSAKKQKVGHKSMSELDASTPGPSHIPNSPTITRTGRHVKPKRFLNI